MSRFLQNVIKRHANRTNTIKPRTRSMFEPGTTGTVFPASPYYLLEGEKGKDRREETETYATALAHDFQPDLRTFPKAMTQEQTENKLQRKGHIPAAGKGKESRRIQGENVTPPFVSSLSGKGDGASIRKIEKKNTGNNSEPEQGELISKWLNKQVQGHKKKSDADDPAVTPKEEKEFFSRKGNVSKEGPFAGQFSHSKFQSSHALSKLKSRKNSPEKPGPPTVEIHIGRIEIRASSKPVKKSGNRSSKPQAVKSLDQFLKEKEGNKQ